MDRNQLATLTKFDILNHRPTIGGVPIWDGTHHGPTDPNGPIGPRGTAGISNGF